MTTYILLRNNKESGPYTLDQLKNEGLKANDLVWVEAQSASWRNPHEIKELKDLVGVKQEPAKTTLPVIPDEPQKVAGSKVFVEMPGKKKMEVAGFGKNDAADIKSQPVQSPPSPTPDLFVPKESIEVKYSMSLDEIKERYVKNLEERKKRKHRLPVRITPAFRQGAVYAGLFLLGASVIWLLMRSNGPVAPATTEQKRIPADFETRSMPVEIAEEPGTGAEDEIMLPESYYDAQESAVLNNRGIGNETAREKLPARNRQERTNATGETDLPVEGDSEGDHRVSIPAHEEAEITTVAPSEVKKQVSVKSNSYTIAALGGIRNLELTLTNASEFLLDKVTVEVRFLNPNGNIVKSEDIHFKSIRPNATQTIAMKKSNRGVKVTYRIVRIESRDAGMETAGL